MPNPSKTRSVYRYFDLADSFIQVLVSDPDALKIPSQSGLNRAAYRRMVIQSCMPEFRGELERSLEMLFPDDPGMAEDLLYQLCVEINPGLDIHEVRLTDQPAPEMESEAPGDGGYEGLLDRLRSRTGGLTRRLERAVIGQHEAVSTVVRSVKKAAVGLGPENRPLATLLFTGRTGTGKTELARVLASELYARAEWSGLVRIDCSEYALAHEYSKLIGSPPGYVGHDEGGQLTDALNDHPESVVLFDEIEKAHPRMHNLLLQILEEGSLTDGRGKRVGFERAIVILTSNAGANEMHAAARPVGFGGKPTLTSASLRSITSAALERLFSPEFLGRLDEQVLFSELDDKTVERIAAKQLYELARRARDRGLRVAFTPAVARWVARRGFAPDYGARELRRVIQREIEPRLSELLLEGSVSRGQMLRARVMRGDLVFEVED